mgnify:CR=1 FL=1
MIAFPPVSFLHWRIPIRYQTESNVVGKVEQRVESYGINNVLITLEIKLTVQQKMILPFEKYRIDFSGGYETYSGENSGHIYRG